MIRSAHEGAEALLEFMTTGGAPKPRWTCRILSRTAQARMVVEYSLHSGAPPQAGRPASVLIGKFYADEGGRRTYAVMRRLARALSGTVPAPLLAVPEALFYDPERRLVIQQRVDGIPFRELLGRRDYRKYFRLAGRAIADLHAQRIPLGEHKGIRDHLRELARPHPLELGEKLPQYRLVIEALLKALGERERSWNGTVEVAPLHRDVHLGQLFYGRGRVWLVDWDLFSKGDPALDVGNFLVYLKTHVGEKARPAMDACLEGYASSSSPSVLERVYVYEAFTYLRLACKHFRLKREGWRNVVKEMLRQSEQSLTRESANEQA